MQMSKCSRRDILSGIAKGWFVATVFLAVAFLVADKAKFRDANFAREFTFGTLFMYALGTVIGPIAECRPQIFRSTLSTAAFGAFVGAMVGVIIVLIQFVGTGAMSIAGLAITAFACAFGGVVLAVGIRVGLTA